MRKITLICLICITISILTTSCTLESGMDKVEDMSTDVSNVKEDVANQNSEQGVTDITENGNNVIELYDVLNRKVYINRKNLRVVTLGKESTSMWILAGGQTIGATEEAIDNNTNLATREIPTIGRIGNINYDQIIALKPNICIVSVQDDANLEIAKKLKENGIETYYIDIKSFSDYSEHMEQFTYVLKNETSYIKNVLEVKSKIDNILLNRNVDLKKNILILSFNENGATAINSNSFVGSIFKDFGCVNIADTYPDILSTMENATSLEELPIEPDCIFALSHGEDYSKVLDVFYDFRSNVDFWEELKAVKNKRVIELAKELFIDLPNQDWADNYEFVEYMLSE